MKKLSAKRRNIIIGLVIIVVLVVSSIGVVLGINFRFLSNQKDNVTVSGIASSGALSQPFPTSLQRIEFADTQTGTVTSFQFSFTPQSNNPAGNYTVSLKNEHTYNVFISYYHGIPPNMKPASDFFTTFTVHAPAGEKAISKDFA